MGMFCFFSLIFKGNHCEHFLKYLFFQHGKIGDHQSLCWNFWPDVNCDSARLNENSPGGHQFSGAKDYHGQNEPLQPFYDGAFRIAIETQQPILPMVILGAGKLMPPRRVFIQPGTVTIYIRPEIPTQGLVVADLPLLKEKVLQEMLAMIASENEAKKTKQTHA